MATKTYTITFDEDTKCMSRTNDGFNAFELIGILKFTSKSILNQLNDKEDPPIKIKKQIVKQ